VPGCRQARVWGGGADFGDGDGGLCSMMVLKKIVKAANGMVSQRLFPALVCFVIGCECGSVVNVAVCSRCIQVQPLLLVLSRHFINSTCSLIPPPPPLPIPPPPITYPPPPPRVHVTKEVQRKCCS
jgi:hypothetical protein